MSLTDALCTQCGLCCDGTLLADVELTGRAEAARVELLGLRIDEDEDRPLMLLPCAALRGTRCTVYAHRPRCCRSFECQLLQDARSGAVTLDRALEVVVETRDRVRRVRGLLSRLGQRDDALPLAERCAESLSERTASEPRAGRLLESLETDMAELEHVIQRTFLGGSSGRTPRSASRPLR